jgi:hypothetical protein
VPRDILLATPEPEIKRQEAIHELIYTEEDYVRDLNLLDEVSLLSAFFGGWHREWGGVERLQVLTNK